MHWAALFGNTDILDALVAEGAPLDRAIGTSGMEPIHWAATRGHVDVISVLLECAFVSVDGLGLLKGPHRPLAGPPLGTQGPLGIHWPWLCLN